MLSKKWLALCLVALLTLSAGLVQAADKSKVLQQAGDKVLQVMGGDEGMSVMLGVAALKQAGLSYQPQLTAPTTVVTACKGLEQLRTLLGMYVYDGLYASAFGKKKELMQIRKVVLDQLFPKLGLVGNKKPQALPSHTVKRVADDPANEANRKILIKNWVAQFETTVKLGQQDPALMDVMVDAIYGAAIQATYVTCKLALIGGMGDKVFEVFNPLSTRLTKLEAVLEAFAADKELAAMVEREERQTIIQPVMKILSQKKGKLTKADLKAILASVEPVRAALIEKCK